MEEIKAKLLAETHRWGDTVILDLEREPLAGGFCRAKGEAEEDELLPGLWYRFYGRWRTHYRHGEQFVFSSVVEATPIDEDGMVRYLCQAPRVGKAVARKLCKLYGSDAIKTLRAEPGRASAEAGIRGFNQTAAEGAAAFLEARSGLEEATVDLMGLLAGRGFPKRVVKKCINRWGNEAAKLVRADPYALLVFKGVGFLGADKLYLDLGHDPASLKRQGLCAWYACASDTEGHTWLEGSAVHAALASKLGATRVLPLGAARWAIGAELLDFHRGEDGAPYFAERRRSEAEASLAELAAQMACYGAPSWPKLDGLDVSDHQRTELRRALRGRLALFGGSPGTGKTYTAARLISRLVAEYGSDQVAVCAPTGKAAVRISEALGEYGIGLRARTVHSYLEVGKTDEDDAEGWAFRRGPGEPVDEQWVICDESSMLDTWLLSKLLGAMRLDGHLLLVGDVNQLPPVGHGAPLRDLITAGVARGELTEIRRNSGAIVSTCAAMRDSRPIDFAGALDLEAGENLMLRSATTGAAAVEEITRTLGHLAGRVDPVWDCQVLVAVNERSPLSRKELNRRLQVQLNAHNRPEREARFWEGDKVVCLKNSFLPLLEDLMGEEDDEEEVVVQEGDDGRPQVYVANGELGRVLEDQPTKTVIEFQAPRRVVLVPKGEDGSSQLDLGYALSVHKAQGSEWPVVLVGLDDYGGARMVCDRAWLYTAVSRARRACILFGRGATARDMCGRVKIDARKTFLVERYQEAGSRLKELVAAGREAGIEAEIEVEIADEPPAPGAQEGVRETA